MKTIDTRFNKLLDKVDETKFDDRHGGAYDRGSADAYYRRPFCPHMFKGATYMSERVEEENMTKDDIEAYATGFYEQTTSGFFKYQ